MSPKHAPHTPQDIDEIIDLLGMMILYSPTFIDQSGFFSGRNVESVFKALNEGLLLVHTDRSETLYNELRTISDRMRAHFEADPEDKTDNTLKGRALIREMTDLLIQSIRTSRRPWGS